MVHACSERVDARRSTPFACVLHDRRDRKISIYSPLTTRLRSIPSRNGSEGRKWMSLNSRQQTPRNVIGARDRFTKPGASGADLVVHYADALRDDDGSSIARERFERQPHHAASTPGSSSYLETLELVNNAARAMATMEDHSQRIQAKALELTQRARADRLEASQYISFLEQQSAACEAVAGTLPAARRSGDPRPNLARMAGPFPGNHRHGIRCSKAQTFGDAGLQTRPTRELTARSDRSAQDENRQFKSCARGMKK